MAIPNRKQQTNACHLPAQGAGKPRRPRRVLARTIHLLGAVGIVGSLLPIYANAAEEVEIGALLPLTGAVADIGMHSRQGMEWAAEQINKNGGIKSLDGATLQLVFADSQSEPQAGLSAMQKLISVDQVPVVTGAFQSAVTLPTTRLAERARVPYLVFSAIGDSITEQGFDYTFRPHAPAKDWATQQFNFLDWLSANKMNELGGKIEEIAFLYENTEYGQSTAENWRNQAEKRGYEVVSDLSYPHGASNMTSTINRLRSADPDAVLLVSYVSDALMIARTEEQLGYKPPIQIGTGGGHSDVAFQESGSGAEGVYTVANWNVDIAKEFNKKFVDSYTESWGVEPTSHAAQGMMNVYILKEVLEDAGSAKPEDIRKALASYKSTNVPPAISGADVVEFNEKGQNPHPEVILTQIQDGEYRTVFPRGAASTEPALPKLQN